MQLQPRRLVPRRQWPSAETENRKMTHWQDKGTCPQALPGTPRGSPSRTSRWRAHTRHLGAKDDDCSFRLFFEKGRRPSSCRRVVVATEAVPPGPTCKGTNPENPKAPFSPQAASPAPPRALACKQKGTQSHTPRSAARFSACCHILVLLSCQHLFFNFLSSQKSAVFGHFQGGANIRS